MNQYIKNMFAQDFLLRNVSVKGEVSNCKYHSSGHIYFSIKDGTSVLNCIMFAGKRSGLDFHMDDGDKVIVTGNINVYERDGKYQLYADKIEKEGKGDLYKRFLLLKEELEDMGMFAQEYKKPIPSYAMSVGIVTASTGAAVQDIINISKRRNPYVRLVLYPSKVQGEGASDTIVKGIEMLDNLGLDVIIIGRGGGSIEDLWAFNEENVARAIFECKTPIISAVGHETDFTIADYVSDLRAPTPSAAAELAVFEYDKFSEKLSETQDRLRRKVVDNIRINRKKVEEINWKLDKMSPLSIIQSNRQQVSDIEIKLNEQIKRKIVGRRHKLELLSEKLNGMSPLNKLSGGYAYVKDYKGRALKSISQVEKDDKMTVYVIDGQVEVKVIEKRM
jgi:exodeoxyribonuclease VII large subunit